MGKGTILGLVGFALDNLLALGAGAFLGHRFAAKLDGVYEVVEGVIARAYALVKPAKRK